MVAFTEELNISAFDNKDLKDWKATYRDLQKALKECRDLIIRSDLT